MNDFNFCNLRTKRYRMLKRAILRCRGEITQNWDMNVMNCYCLMTIGTISDRIYILKREFK